MQSSKEIKFGTDGWRGIISDNFTFENVRRVAQAIADYYNRQTRKPANPQTKIAVGYDTRFLSGNYAQTVSEILAANGIDVVLSDKTVSTPMLSFTVPQRKLTAGIMITASHNPAEYNGIKIKTSAGGAAGIEVTKEVERLLSVRPGEKRHKPAKIEKSDLTKDYIKFLRNYIDLEKLKSANFKVLVDAMYGSGNGYIAEVLKNTKLKLEFIRNNINPSFGGLRPEPVLENLRPTMERLKDDKFDLCLILDGDADRIAAFADGREFINPQKALGLLILHLIQDRKMSGAVVKTIVGTNLIDKIAEYLGLKVYETPVGFKYISELMQTKDILVGGEEAGGIGFKNYIPERDGILAGLLLLEMVAFRKKPMIKILEDMEKQFGRYYYLRQDLKLPITNYQLPITKIKSLDNLLGNKIIDIKDYDGIKLICSDESWLMFRASGTEPIMRIYAESKSLRHSQRLLELGKSLVIKTR